jgi:hypothetical protein
MTLENFKMQKAMAFKDAINKKPFPLVGDYIITEKVEGWWVGIFFDASTQKWCTPMSSAYKQIKAFEWVEPLLQDIPKPDGNCMLIAEAYIPGNKFKKTNGLFNRSIGDYHCKDTLFMCHDLVMLEGPESARHRYRMLFELFNSGMMPSCFKLLPILHTGVYNQSRWDSIYKKIIRAGGEGIIIKKASEAYQCGKRNMSLLKLKLDCVIDTLAIGLEEGVGKKGNDSLTLISQRKNGVVIRTLISRDADKKLYREAPETIIGKVVAIKAMEEFEDGALRHPIFSHIREDKLPSDIG